MRRLLSAFRPRTSLEDSIIAGLPNAGNRRHDLARWVATGRPRNIDLSVSYRDLETGDERSRRAMIDAVAASDPAVEWRLGQLFADHHGSYTKTARALLAIALLRREWPDDNRIQALAEVGRVDLVDVLSALVTSWRIYNFSQVLRHRPLFNRLAHENPGVLADALWEARRDPEPVANAISDFTPEALNPLAPTVADFACGANDRRRLACARLLAGPDSDVLIPEFRRVLLNGDASARAQAIRAWADIAGDDLAAVIEFCDEHCADDRASSVQQAIADLRERAADPTPEAQVEWPTFDGSDLSDDERRALLEIIDEADRGRRAGYERSMEWRRNNPNNKGLRGDLQPPQPTSAAAINQAVDYLRTGVAKRPEDMKFRIRANDAVLRRFSVFHVFRVLRLAGHANWRTIRPVFRVLADRCDATGHPTLLEVQAAAEAAGYSREFIVSALPERPGWSRDQIAEWAVAVLPELIHFVSEGDTERGRPDRFYDAIATLPTLPPKLRQVLVDQAVGPRKTRRPLARKVLAEFPGSAASALEYLSSRRYEERAEAANWLAELDATEAIPALHAAASSEQHDTALGAELSALASMDESIEVYLSPEALAARAERDLNKPMPAGAEWVPLEALPTPLWLDGSVVDPRLIDWLVRQAVRTKSAVPSPIVRRLFQRMEPRSVATFVETILALWIAQDLQPISAEEATARAERDFKGAVYFNEYPNLDDSELMALMLARHVGAPAGSAIGSKGLLSLVAAGGDLAVVAPAESYVRKWYGRRASQCKSLIEMLAWVDDPAATQFVLSVGNRFRTKGIQAEALQQAELLAERNGWTLDDLADRTVPDGGFDTDGRLTIDYGTRTFEARLGDDLRVVLSDESGKTIKALPSARTTDDEDQVKLAKQDFSASKKHIAAAAKEQPQRLYEAMCTQRTFDVADFDRYILGHPVMQRLATRLVWVAVEGDNTTLFRPLSNATLLDAHDDEITIGNADHVRLAHEVVDGRAAAEEWRAHLVDYKVNPLFAQFDRPDPGAVSDGQLDWTGCRGAIIDDRRLRAAMAKVGFRNGEVADAANVITIEREFPTIDLTAWVQVRGLNVSILETDVALDLLGFSTLADDERVPLSEVPPVLLVETIAAVEQLMAAGEGIDPNWQERVEW